MVAGRLGHGHAPKIELVLGNAERAYKKWSVDALPPHGPRAWTRFRREELGGESDTGKSTLEGEDVPAARKYEELGRFRREFGL